jgi:hypothetical protein
MASDAFNNEFYQDAHVGVFHPVSFLNLIKVIIILGLFDYVISDFLSTEQNEIDFFYQLTASSTRFWSKRASTNPVE